MSEDVNKELYKIKEELNSLIIEIRNYNSNENNYNIHKKIIEVSSNKPEYKELLEYVIFMDDHIQTSSKEFEDFIIEHLHQLMILNKELVRTLNEKHHYMDDEKNVKNKKIIKIKDTLIQRIKNLSKDDVKEILFYIVIISVSIAIISFPKDIETLNKINEVISSKK